MTRTMDSERDRIIRTEIRNAGLGGILLWYPEDIVMSCGTWPCLGINLCLYPADGVPWFFAPENEPPDAGPDFAECQPFSLGAGWSSALSRLISGSLKRLGIAPDEVGVADDSGVHAMTSFAGETPPLTHTLVMNGLFSEKKPVIVPELFTSLTLIKTSRELALVRTANEVAGKGLQAFYKASVPGTTEAEVAAAVEYAIQCTSGKDGHGLARGWAHVQGGRNILSGGTYSRSSGNELKDGDLVLIELSTCVDGYWSDLTRTAGVGSIDQGKRDLLTAVKQAQKKAIEAVRPGVSHESVYAAARGSFSSKGLAEGFPHNCGHQVGFRYHDRGPTLFPGQTEPLKPGMVITVEPGTYAAAYGGGARFEDDIAVREGGADMMSPIDLQPV